jgi:mannosyltransferase OCH1-like enzyme
MRKSTIIFSIFILTIFYSCIPTKSTSTIVGGQYEPKTNTTDYFVIPLGSVSLSGKWTKGQYNSSARQQWFSNQDSVSTAIAFTPCNKYEFYTPNLKDLNFLMKFYEWESKFYSQQLKTDSKIIESDSTKNYIIWRLYDNKNIDTYFLYGFNKCSVHNYSVASYKWTDNEKVNFLRNLYLNKK